jgi:hypothetical protein
LILAHSSGAWEVQDQAAASGANLLLFQIMKEGGKWVHTEEKQAKD